MQDSRKKQFLEKNINREILSQDAEQEIRRMTKDAEGTINNFHILSAGLHAAATQTSKLLNDSSSTKKSDLTHKNVFVDLLASNNILIQAEMEQLLAALNQGIMLLNEHNKSLVDEEGIAVATRANELRYLLAYTAIFIEGHEVSLGKDPLGDAVSKKPLKITDAILEEFGRRVRAIDDAEAREKFTIDFVLKKFPISEKEKKAYEGEIVDEYGKDAIQMDIMLAARQVAMELAHTLGLRVPGGHTGPKR